MELSKEVAEYEFDWLTYVRGNFPDTFKEDRDYSKAPDLYIDQLPYRSEIYDRTITSILLETGLKRMESWMIYQITNGSKYSKEELIKMIKLNPHLHNIIKTNLLDNLKSSPYFK